MKPRYSLLLCSCIAFALCASGHVLAVQDETAPPADGGGATAQPTDPTDSSNRGAENAPMENGAEITPELNAAVAQGLSYLAQEQNVDGSFGDSPRYGQNVGIAGLCALAFMADGHTPDRGEYRDQVRKALDYVLNNSHESGLLAAETSHGPMYGHGFATLFLGEVYGMGGADEDPRLRETLVKAVRLIVNSQNPEGGWRYNPIPGDADVSVTICQVMAMRSARNAGIKVPKETIDRAVEYIRRCQNPDGGWRYMMTTQGASFWPRSAAGIATLFYAGVYDDEAIDRGVEYLMTSAFPGTRRQQAHFYYGHYYAAQAMYLAGGEAWEKWWPACRAELLDAQDAESGGWLDHHAGGPYATAMSLIVLQMPKRYLPIFQR